MKYIALGLLAVCIPLCAQIAPTTQQAGLIASEQSAAVGVAILSASPSFLYRTATGPCEPLVIVQQPDLTFIAPQPGYYPSWKSDQYDSLPRFQADSVTSDTQNNNTNAMQAEAQSHPWESYDQSTPALAATTNDNIVANSSSYVNQWSSNGNLTTETNQQTEVTINGKTYRRFKHELDTTPIPYEAGSFNGGIVICR